MTCGTAWARFCRLRETRPLPPSVSSPPWSWRPAAPSCRSPSSPEPCETSIYHHCPPAAQTMDGVAAHVCSYTQADSMKHATRVVYMNVSHTHSVHMATSLTCPPFPRCLFVAVTLVCVRDHTFASTVFCTLCVHCSVFACTPNCSCEAVTVHICVSGCMYC